MPPDFLLRCTTCDAEAIWDTEAIPPVGLPAPGHPVLWHCAVCGDERRHVIADSIVIPDKLRHEICVATELDRRTVDRAMAELARLRRGRTEAAALEAAADLLQLAAETVAEILAAESAWLIRRGYPVDSAS
jgi:hypothetical protein